VKRQMGKGDWLMVAVLFVSAILVFWVLFGRIVWGAVR
jgi:hypothetical protein